MQSSSWEAQYELDWRAQTHSGPVVLDEECRSKNKQLRDRVRDVLPVQDMYKLGDCDLLYRFLIGSEWQVAAAEQSVRAYVDMRRDERLDGILAEPPHPCLREMLARVFGVDVQGLPVLWMTPDPAVLLPATRLVPRATLLREQMHVMEAARYVAKARGVDRCTCVLDLSKVTMSSVNAVTLALLRDLTRVLQQGYPEVMRRLLVYNTGWAVTGAWKVVRPFVNVRVQDKIRFYSGPPCVASLAEFVEPQHVLPMLRGDGGAEGYKRGGQQQQQQQRNSKKAACDGDGDEEQQLGGGDGEDEVSALLAREVARLRRGSAANVSAPAEATTAVVEACPLSETLRLSDALATEPLPLAYDVTSSHNDDNNDDGPAIAAVPDVAAYDARVCSPCSLCSLDSPTMTSSSPRRRRPPPQHDVVASAATAATVTGSDATARTADRDACVRAAQTHTPAVCTPLSHEHVSPTNTMAAAATTLPGGGAPRRTVVVVGAPDVLSEFLSLSSLQSDSTTTTATTTQTDETRVVDKATSLSSSRSSDSSRSRSSSSSSIDSKAAAAATTTATSAVVATTTAAPAATCTPTRQQHSVSLTLVPTNDGRVVGYHRGAYIAELRDRVVLVVLARAATPSSTSLQLQQQQQQQCETKDTTVATTTAAAAAAVGEDACDARPRHSGSGSGSGCTGRRDKDNAVRQQQHDDCGGGSGGVVAMTSSLRPPNSPASSSVLVVGELLRESGHVLHPHLILCNAQRHARFCLRQGRLRTRLTLYQVWGETAVATQRGSRHRIVGERVRMAVVLPRASHTRNSGNNNSGNNNNECGGGNDKKTARSSAQATNTHAGVAVPPSSPPSAPSLPAATTTTTASSSSRALTSWTLYGDDLTRRRDRAGALLRSTAAAVVAAASSTFASSSSSSSASTATAAGAAAGAPVAAKALLAEYDAASQTVSFYPPLTDYTVCELFLLAVAINSALA